MSIRSSITAIVLLAGAIITGCQHSTTTTNDQPKANAPATAAAPQTSYANAGEDTSAVVIDKNAKDGLNTINYKNGVIKAKGYCRSGKKYGEWQSFYPDGKLCSDEYFTEGMQDGKVTTWYDSNQKRYEGEYKKGKPTGVWSYWNAQGKLLRTSDYNKKPSDIAL